MRRSLIPCAAAGALCLVLAAATASARDAPEDFGTWPPMRSTFPSTGGGGFVIGEYRPVVVGDRCATDFTVTGPDGAVARNTVEFDAVPAQGGTLCTNGRWRALDGGGAAGTTPFRVFFRDGVARGWPLPEGGG
jgi:hypothetical protein